MKVLALMCFLYLGFFCEAYKFLVVFPLPMKSLNSLGEGLVKHLLDAGHEVTFMSVFPLKKEPKSNYTRIDLSDSATMGGAEADNYTIEKLMDNKMTQKDLYMLSMFGLLSAKYLFENEAVKKFLEDETQKFDAVIAESYETELYAGFAALYGCPMIWSYCMGAHLVSMRLVDGPTNPAYVPDYMSSNIPPLTFGQRLEELLSYIYWIYVKKFYTRPEEEHLYKEVFEPIFQKRGKILPPYEDVTYNASLMLANDHLATGNIPKIPINFKFVGGQHIDRPTKPLPQNLQTLMDNAKDGVIYFSLGSMWKSKDLPKEVTEGLLKVFGELKQTVIWKFEAELQNVPKNVHILEWAPQQSILAHPNCRIFISHGGLLSSLESAHFGVPIIGVPVYLDQFINVNKGVAHGYAIKTNLNRQLPDQIRIAIQKMLADRSYTEKAKELSAVYHDRPMTPGAEAVYWVEHVVRTRGAPHLRSPALHVPWYQQLYLDLAAIVVGALIGIKIAISRLLSVVKSKKSNLEKKRN